MTVNVAQVAVAYAGDGTTTALAVPFPFLAASDLVVTQILANGSSVTLGLNIGYTVAGAGIPTGGTVTLAVPASVGVTTRIKRRTPRLQPVDFAAFGSFPAPVIEGALDRGVMLDQEDIAETMRAIMVPDDDPQTGQMVLPGQTARAGRLAGYDANGRPAVGASMALVETLVAGAVPTSLPGQNVVTTFAAMTALPKATLADGVSVLALGGAARGDGSGGVFWWDAASVLATDGVNVLAANEGGTGRWRRAAFLGSSTFASITVSGLLSAGSANITGDLLANNLAAFGSVTGTTPGTGGGAVRVLENAGLARGAIDFLNAAGTVSRGQLRVSNAGALRWTGTGGAEVAGPLRVEGHAFSVPASSINSAATTNINLPASNVHRVAMVANITTLNLNSPQDGATYNIWFTQDGTGSRTITWPTSFRWGDGVTAPALSTTAGRVDLLVATWNATTERWAVQLLKNVGA